ncbi:MAG: LCP family protein [Candidatus Woesebacteria bacterium]
MNRDQFLRLAQKITGLILIASYILGAIAAVKAQVVPVIMLAILLPIIAIASLALVVMNFMRSLPLGKSLALMTCSLLISLGGLYVYNMSTSTSNFISSIQADNYIYEEYSVIAKKDSQISLKPESSPTIGTLAIDSNKNLASAELTNKTPAKYKDFNELASLTVAINKNEVDGAILKTPYVQLLEDNYKDFYQNIKVIDVIKVKVQQLSSDQIGDTSQPFAIYINCSGAIDGSLEPTKSNASILAVINPQSHKILTVSTPGEYYVLPHGTSGAKDRLAFIGIDGIEASKLAISDLYGIEIDYYVQANLQTIVRLVDALGGVDMEVNGTNQHLDGKTALMLMVSPQMTLNKDAKIQSQKKLTQAIVSKINNPETLVNYQSLLKKLEGTIKTNAGTDIIANLANQQMNNLSKWSLDHIVVDGTAKQDYTRSSGKTKVEVIEPDQKSIDNAKNTIKQYQ